MGHQTSRYDTDAERAFRQWETEQILAQAQARQSLYHVKRPSGKDLLIVFCMVTASAAGIIWVMYVAVGYALRSLFGS